MNTHVHMQLHNTHYSYAHSNTWFLVGLKIAVKFHSINLRKGKTQWIIRG
uniref:Uncharacterized protein n=1 Tax=Octopus bimaculoides TaxID=37653 RepID=A0A0L8H6Y2_OCTBM